MIAGWSGGSVGVGGARPGCRCGCWRSWLGRCAGSTAGENGAGHDQAVGGHGRPVRVDDVQKHRSAVASSTCQAPRSHRRFDVPRDPHVDRSREPARRMRPAVEAVSGLNSCYGRGVSRWLKQWRPPRHRPGGIRLPHPWFGCLQSDRSSPARPSSVDSRRALPGKVVRSGGRRSAASLCGTEQTDAGTNRPAEPRPMPSAATAAGRRPCDPAECAASGADGSVVATQ
jgi:hypothetical protein